MSAATWIDTEDPRLARKLLRRGSWTVEEFLELPKAATRVELLDGELVVAAAPASDHLDATSNLFYLLRRAKPGHLKVVSEGNLRIGPSTLFRPDVMVVVKQSRVVTYYQAADAVLVAEIVSPGSRRMDRSVKPQKYAAAGIGWYLRIEMQDSRAPSPEVIAYRLKDGEYVESTRAHEGQVLHLTEPFEVSFDPAVLLYEDHWE